MKGQVNTGSIFVKNQTSKKKSSLETMTVDFSDG